ncbi:Efflux transporter, RND family, MFP subunit [Pseudoalteromonas luteoviolacea B = ATCC 29581]|nr:Efflux transporter, RND family, MFP subunit [Pseudoalteromonas luteoviolacea B = ATCC 29581]
MNIKSKTVYQGLLVLSGLLLLSGWQLGFNDSAPTVERSSLSIAKVEQGDFSIKVDGYGLLQSRDKRLITSTSNAIVDEIILKAGAIVDENTVILTLKNPELEGKLRQALASLKSAKTQKRQLTLSQQRELINNQSSISELKAKLEIAMLQVDAERFLAKSGIVSGISAKKNELEAKQLAKNIELEESKLDKLKSMQLDALSIQDDLIAQAQGEFDVAKEMVEQLSVKAGLNGVIQRMPLNLGQSVSAGAELALIGTLSPLIAEVKVPQIQAYLIREGMPAEINSLNERVAGIVHRVDPVINEGAVQIDIKLTESPSSNLRPMQQVDATIFANVQKGSTYITQPSGVSENTTVSLFKLGQDGHAALIEVSFGKTSGQHIEVLSGLEPGEQVIISQLELPAETKRIKVSG